MVCLLTRMKRLLPVMSFVCQQPHSIAKVHLLFVSVRALKLLLCHLSRELKGTSS